MLSKIKRSCISILFYWDKRKPNGIKSTWKNQTHNNDSVDKIIIVLFSGQIICIRIFISDLIVTTKFFQCMYELMFTHNNDSVDKIIIVLFSGQRTLHHAKSTSNRASKGVGTTSVYSATKSAVRSFVPTLTVYLKHRNILIKAVLVQSTHPSRLCSYWGRNHADEGQPRSCRIYG